MQNQSIEAVVLQTGPNATAAVIWLHGLGADGNDFVPIVQEFSLSGCGDVRFIFPHAPTMPVTINNGYVMRAWYDILGTDLVRREDEAGIVQSASLITQLIQQQRELGIAANRIVLAGFSQGCAMSLYTGLRYPETLAGIVALSGYLPVAAKTQAQRAAQNQATPIFMAHGSSDPVVPQARAIDSRVLLTSLGYVVQWKSYSMQHSVHPQEVADIDQFLQSVLS